MAEVAAILQTFTYDADGNLTSDGLVDYQWDAENRLVRMETDPTAVTCGFPHHLLQFRYDYMGRRVLKQVLSWDSTQGAWGILKGHFKRERLKIDLRSHMNFTQWRWA